MVAMRITGLIVALGLGSAGILGVVAPAAIAGVPADEVNVTAKVPGGATRVAAQGKVIATVSESGRSVSIVDAQSLAVRSTTTLPETPSTVVLGPDGSLAYVLAGAGIYVIDTTTGALVRSATYDSVKDSDCSEVTKPKLSRLAISPNGGRLNVGAEIGCDVEKIWSIDPISLTVGDKAAITRVGRGLSLGNLNGPLVSFNDRILTTLLKQNDYCSNSNGCPPDLVVVTSSGDSAGRFPNGSEFGSPKYASFSALTRDPVAGTLIATDGRSLIWVEPGSGVVLRHLDGVVDGVSSLIVDPLTGLIYGQNGSGTVVVDPVAGKVLGMHTVAVDEVINGRGYHATTAGIDVMTDASQMLVPTKPLSVSAKVGRAVKGRVNATVTWQPPAAAGSSPVTAYLVQAYSRRNAADKKPVVRLCRAGVVSRRCIFDLKQVTTTNSRNPALYTFTVTPMNDDGNGASGTVQVTAP